MFQVIDTQTKIVVGTYSTLRRATNKADKLDLQYGAIRYRVVSIAFRFLSADVADKVMK